MYNNHLWAVPHLEQTPQAGWPLFPHRLAAPGQGGSMAGPGGPLVQVMDGPLLLLSHRAESWEGRQAGPNAEGHRSHSWGPIFMPPPNPKPLQRPAS